MARVGGSLPRVETGDRLSRVGRRKVHALIGGELLRGGAIVSRGGSGQLQEQSRGAERSGRTASTEGQGARRQPKSVSPNERGRKR